MRSFQIYRTTLDDNITERYRVLKSDTEIDPQKFCKRFNAWATRNDFPNHYSYKEIE